MTSETPASPPEKAPSLLRSGMVVSIMTMLSRVLGMVRDVVIAAYFGSGSSADAFFIAFKIPNFMRRLFAEGAFNQAFVPVLSEYRAKRAFEEVRDLVNRVAGTLALTLVGITAVGVAGAPVLISVFAPGFHDEPEKLALAADMLRITFPYLLLISLTALCGSILNSYGRFAVPAFTPVLLNVSMIGATLVLTPYFDQPVMALAWGVFIAGVVQLLFQLPFLAQIRLLPVPRPDRKHEGVKRIMTLMVPALFGVSVSQINLLLDTVLASFLQTGSISWLYYADRLSELPLGAFGIAIGTVILPALSRQHAGDDPKGFAATLDWAVRMVLLVGVPAALALLLLAEPLIATLFHYGAMTEGDVLQSAAALRAYAVGVLTFMLIKVLAPGFFARQDMKTPVKIAMICMGANMVFNLILIWPLAHVGLALATSMSALLNAGLLWWGLRKAGIYEAQPGWPVFILRLVLACAAMAAIVLWLAPGVSEWFDWGWQQKALEMTILVVAGIGAYLAALLVAGLRMRHLRHG
ncbi:murein biosynthesis integral membrane protein MurJ [Halopseudomonas nanhaiensis]|uniref:murein biosynthesis integral membrane protein MurJ n=1 Tax=Halopseudomonas nanhaiensis TaxID=2830842 RepID=UPI001CBB8BEB|nr:murein biosynthesis integral membrane protein MurJ [Halopseudomonas nanhaiensis]UAW99035.1 murein biosynthesis integral membrane protein MurJ [Halopseudomonas nanhaiensis]